MQFYLSKAIFKKDNIKAQYSLLLLLNCISFIIAFLCGSYLI